MKLKRHYQEIKDDFFDDNLLNNLLLAIPEIEKELDGYFDVFFAIGVFGHFVIENANNEELYQRCIKFINASFSLGSYKTEDAFVLQVFSDIYDDVLLADRFQCDLKEKALNTFLKYKDL